METPLNTDRIYLWMDLETNGRQYDDPMATIFEVAAVFTTNQFTKFDRYVNEVIQTPDSYIDDFYDNGPEIVINMHEDSGLTGALFTNKHLLPPLYDVDQWLGTMIPSIKTEFLQDHDLSKEPEVYLAGSGVSHFDSRWIERHMPRTWHEIDGYDHVTKPTLDIGVVRRFLQGFTTLDFGQTESTHRAMDDVKHFIFEAKRYVELLNYLNEMHLSAYPPES